MKNLVVFVLLGTFLYKDVYSRKIAGLPHKSHNNKIVGGYNATIEQFPYQVLLIVSKGAEMYGCGGSIISNTVILTAAHCIAGASKVYVKSGATSSNAEGDTIGSSKLTPHPNYSKRTQDYDVGIITLERPIKLDGVKTKIVRLADKNTQINPGRSVTVTGWGATSENGPGSDSLLAVDVPIVSNDECRKAYRTLTTRMFCAGVPQGGKDACQGDSGGPAVFKPEGIQIGVVSHGIGCARRGYPGVYTSVASVRDWIKQVSGV